MSLHQRLRDRFLRAVDQRARRLTWDGKESGGCRRLQLPLLGVILLQHARYPGGTRQEWRVPAHICHAPKMSCPHPAVLCTVPNQCSGCRRLRHARIWLGLADRWLRWRFSRCPRCLSRFTWRELGPRGRLQRAESGSRWHHDCEPVRLPSFKPIATPFHSLDPAEFEHPPRRVYLPGSSRGATEAPSEGGSP